MNSEDSLAGVGAFSTGGTLSDHFLENVSVCEPMDTDLDYTLEEPIPRSSWSQPNPPLDCNPWNAVDFWDPPCASAICIGSNPVSGFHHTIATTTPEQIGDLDASIAPWPRMHDFLDVQGGSQPNPLLTPDGYRQHLTRSSRSNTQNSWTPNSTAGTSHHTSDEPTRPDGLSEINSHETKFKMPKGATTLLKSVFLSSPYPDDENYTLMAKHTGVSEKRIRTWFTNKRHRTNTRSSSVNALTRRSKELMDAHYDPLNAVNRYIETQTTNNYLTVLETPVSGRQSAPPELNIRHHSYASSSRASSVHSGQNSGGSNVSTTSRASRASKKGVRKFPWQPKQKKHQPHSRPFVCTFGCTQSFSSNYDWKRHENSVHTLQESWTCNNPSTDYLPQVCPYDLMASPTPDHLASHGHDACIRQDVNKRTFYRIDHILEHLRRVHSVKDTAQMAAVIASWRGSEAPLPPGDPALHCGFCGKNFAQWGARVAHVGEHFKKGKQFVDWWPHRKDTTLNLIEMLPQQPVDVDPTEPVHCLSCGLLFGTLEIAQKEHVICRFYSCRFLTKIEGTSSYRLNHGALCVYCGKLNKSYQGPHIETEHRFRGCKQHIFMSGQKFRDHLEEVHAATHSEKSSIWNEMDGLFSEPRLVMKPSFGPWGTNYGFTCSRLNGLHVGLSGDICECEHRDHPLQPSRNQVFDYDSWRAFDVL